MAVAPLNKFINISVPVAPGEQVVYTTPTGVASIVLFAQVANVTKNSTFSDVTCKQRRTTRLGNTRDIRLVKDAEVYPNDTLVLVEGRLVLEKTALVSDSLVIVSESTNAGIVSIQNCTYNEVTGDTTITTSSPHGFSLGDEIAMSGLEFTCPPGSGITTSIFPSPQIPFTVTQVNSATEFETNAGVGAGIQHTHVANTGLVAPLELEFTCSILENSIV